MFLALCEVDKEAKDDIRKQAMDEINPSRGIRRARCPPRNIDSKHEIGGGEKTKKDIQGRMIGQYACRI